MEKITTEGLLALGLIPDNNKIQEGYYLVLEDIKMESFFPGDSIYYHYKSLSVSLCNDKGKGEYYLFFRDGNTEHRHEDDIVTITRSLEYIEELQVFINLAKKDHI